MNKWEAFYKDRVNSHYQVYFEHRYKLFLQLILGTDRKHVVEEGISIGSVSKFLRKRIKDGTVNFTVAGFDMNPNMVELAKLNTKMLDVYVDNILQPNIKQLIPYLAVTHGVLEHFTDIEILSIMQRYKTSKTANIHYVPLDKYHTPSFGDERLLPYQYWLDLIKPKDYLLMNNDHDLILINL